MDGGSEVAKRGDRVAAILGHVVWLMSQSSKHKHLTLIDMDWLVVPALINRQFKLYRLDGKPFAYASWAYVSLDVVQRVAVEGGNLSAGEWMCGDEAWLVDVVAPFGGAEGVLREMKAKGISEMLGVNSSVGGGGEPVANVQGGFGEGVGRAIREWMPCANSANHDEAHVAASARCRNHCCPDVVQI